MARRPEQRESATLFALIRLRKFGTGWMVGQPQALRAPLRRFVPQQADPASGLWRLLLWGGTATCALLIVVLAGRSEIGSQRASAALGSLSGASLLRSDGPPVHKFDAEAETRRLSEAVRGLAVEGNQLKLRLDALEHNMDDVTGSISKQIDAVKAATAERAWPSTDPPTPATPETIASVVEPQVPPPSGIATPVPTNPLMPSATKPAEAPPTEYGVDIGSAVSIQALRARWAGIRSAHPEIFDKLQAVATLKELARSTRAELRLVVGPLADADAATQLCASLSAYRVYCRPTTFDRQHLALQ
jgi:hypothetical protein